MIGIVSGNTLGLELGSLATLRPHGGTFGTAEQGRSGVAAYVNVANGNLVLQSRDEFLAARGLDAQSVRTYNSQGLLDAAGSWSQGFVQPLRLTGVLNAAGSTIARTGRDGSVGLYRFDAARNLYVTTDGDGPDDTLAFIAADQQFEWRDGASGLVQRYEGAGSYRLLASRDASGNALTYQYNAGGQLSAVRSDSGDTTFYDYTGANLTQIRVVTAEGSTLTRTRYAHDASGRLVEVTVDLTPEDNSIADGRVYRTQYAYDGSSQRIAQLTQSDGTRLDFSYVQVGATEWRVASIANALGETTRFTYSLTPGAAGFATVTDALGLVTRFDLDAAGQLVRVTSPIAPGATSTRQFVYNARGDVLSVTDGEGRAISYEYDASGNPVLQRDGGGNTVRRSFDARGRLLTQTVYLQPDADGAGPLQPGEAQTLRQVWDSADRGLLRFVISAEGEVTEHRYNGFGERTSSITYLGGRYAVAGLAADAVPTEAQLIAWAATQNPAAAQREDSTYDARGQLQTRTTYTRLDASGAGVLGGTQSTETFVRDAFGRLLQTISPTGAATGYAYDAAGQLTAITDSALGQVTRYSWDLGGRRIRERVTQGARTYQDNHLAYDALGRLRDVADARVHITLAYDSVGNRTRITTRLAYQGTDGEAVSSSDRHFQYDAMNRQTVVDAVDAAGNLGTQGHRITYDQSGNRTSDTFWGNRVSTTTPVIGQDESGANIYASTPTYTAGQGLVTERYGYDALNRLITVVRDGELIDQRLYDGADRLIRSGPDGALAVGFSQALNQNVATQDAIGLETRIHRYDANGRLLHQRVLDSRNGAKLDVSYDPNERLTIAGQTYAAAGHDAAGNTLGYVLEDHLAGQATQYNLTLARFEGYQASVTSATGSGGRKPGSSTQHYDANGFLIGVTDATNANNNRTFVNDASGIALMVDQGGRLQRQLVVDGEVLGRYGVAATEQDSRGNPSFANLVDLDFGYARITANYPDAAPGLYQVRSGDTLESIAQASYGERSLWWRIAEANGLGSNAELKVGQSLNIPNRVGTVGNNAESFKPYDPSRIKGDTSPHMAQPAQDRGCGGMGKLLMAVVAVAVTVYTGGGAMGAALGSIASQGVGLMTGDVESFSWQQVGLSAISGAVAGAMPLTAGLGSLQFAARAAVGNVITQGLGVMTGLQSKFDWRGVAASTVGAGVGQAVSSQVGDSFGARLATGLIAGTAAAVARGGRVAIQQVAVDAFGNALGQSFEELAEDTVKARPSNLPPPAMTWRNDFEVLTDADRNFEGSIIVGSPLGVVEFSQDEYEAIARGLHQAIAAPRPELASDESDKILIRKDSVLSDSGSGILVRDGRHYYVSSRGLDGLGMYHPRSDVAVVTRLAEAAVSASASETKNEGLYDTWRRLNVAFGTSINFSELSRFEGGQLLNGYVPQSRGQVLGRSGVTIATGFDVGQIAATQLTQLNLPGELTLRLRPYAGLIRAEAVAFLERNPLTVSRDEAMTIDYSVKASHLRSAIQAWSSAQAVTPFIELTPAQQTVIFSRTFHQGVGMPNTRQARDFYSAATQGRWQDAEAALRNYPVRDAWYKRRVGLEADLLIQERKQ